MIGSAFVVGIEGAQAAGKTTVALALVASLRENGVHAEYVDESGRRSPLIREVIINKSRSFDIEVEMDLFADQLLTLLRHPEGATIIVVDKTIYNTLAYSQLALGGDSRSKLFLSGMDAIVSTFGYLYDLVLFISDEYVTEKSRDPFRVTGFTDQGPAKDHIRSVLAHYSVPVEVMPEGWANNERVDWCSLIIQDRFPNTIPG